MKEKRKEKRIARGGWVNIYSFWGRAKPFTWLEGAARMLRDTNVELARASEGTCIPTDQYIHHSTVMYSTAQYCFGEGARGGSWGQQRA